MGEGKKEMVFYRKGCRGKERRNKWKGREKGKKGKGKRKEEGI